jgi:multiple sugar transport system substrate-binding protein
VISGIRSRASQFASPPQEHRPLAATGEQLPDFVQRQSAIQGLIGEELASAIAGTKSVDQALADAERRVDELLGQVL